MNINGSRIIITGAGSGFGKGMALKFAEAGARVAAIDINVDALSQLKKEQPSIETWNCNVADNGQVEITIDSIFSQWGGVEVLINNAGIMKNAPLINMLDKNEKKHSVE